jgi:hypothetical protein
MARAIKVVGAVTIAAVAIAAGSRWFGRMASGLRAAPRGPQGTSDV